jgi:hypothetical protein
MALLFYIVVKFVAYVSYSVSDIYLFPKELF